MIREHPRRDQASRVVESASASAESQSSAEVALDIPTVAVVLSADIAPAALPSQPMADPSLTDPSPDTQPPHEDPAV